MQTVLTEVAPALPTPAVRRVSCRRALAWRVVVPRAVAVWGLTRLFAVLLTALFVGGSRLHAWMFFDAGFYASIARHGYIPTRPDYAPFFPLYPLLVHLVLVPTDADAGAGADVTMSHIAALAVANLGTLAAFVLVGLLAAHEMRDARAAWSSVIVLAASPLAVFLAGAYSEGLFIALVAGGLLAARQRAWGWAAVAAALAIVARPFGVLLVLALVVEYASQHAWWWRIRTRQFTRPAPALVLLLVAPCVTFAAYLAMLWHQYGDPLLFLHAEGTWGHVLAWPWQTVALAGREWRALPHWSWPSAHLLLDLVPVLLCLVVALTKARTAPLPWTVLTLGVVLICLSTPLGMPHFPDPLASDGRYCYAAVPVLIPLAGWARRWPRWLSVGILVASLTLQAILTVFVLRGGWLV